MTTRIQLSRAKGWRMPPDTVKVDRSTPWGNPIEIGACCRIDVDGDMVEATVTQAIAVEFYREYLAGALRQTPNLLEPLRGRNLACWCKPGQPCHADVLLEFANK